MSTGHLGRDAGLRQVKEAYAKQMMKELPKSQTTLDTMKDPFLGLI